jgi:hypothetical protein
MNKICDDVVTFQDKQKRFTLVVKKEFLKVCPNPEKKRIPELFREFNLMIYLHCETGPAVIRHRDNRREYWINGELVEREKAEKMQYDFDFKIQLDDIINE